MCSLKKIQHMASFKIADKLQWRFIVFIVRRVESQSAWIDYDLEFLKISVRKESPPFSFGTSSADMQYFFSCSNVLFPHLHGNFGSMVVFCMCAGEGIVHSIRVIEL